MKIRNSIKYGKPPKNTYIRVKREAEWSFKCLLWARSGKDHYIVDDSLIELARDHVVPVVLRLAVDRLAEPYLIPAMLPNGTVRLHPWNVSRNAALKVAETQWVRLVPNMAKAQYEVFATEADFGEPAWPEESEGRLVELAFAGKVIRDAGDPLLDAMLGRG